MSKSKQPKNQLFLERLSEEFTSGQLVVGISFTLFVVIVSFACGYLLGRVDVPLESSVQTAMRSAEKPVDVSAGEQTGTSPRGGQTSPKLPSETTSPAAPPASVPSNSGISEMTKPRVTELPPLPAPQKRGDAGGAPVKVTKVPLPKPAETAPVEVAPAATTPAAEPEVNPTEAAPETTVAPKPIQVATAEPSPAGGETPPVLEPLTPSAGAESPAEPATPATASGTGAWGIQVASFQGADRKEKAGDFQRRLKQNADIDSKIFASEDDRYYRVLITGYNDRAAAKAVCDELKKRAGFADAFPRLLP